MPQQNSQEQVQHIQAIDGEELTNIEWHPKEEGWVWMMFSFWRESAVQACSCESCAILSKIRFKTRSIKQDLR